MAGSSSLDASLVLSPDAKVDEADFTAVVFHGVSDIYPPEKDIECCYTIKPSVKPTNKDWVGLFKVGWQYSKEHYTYEWSPFVVGDEEEPKSIANRVLFKAKYLPKCDEEFYQFCYVTNSGEVRGASVPFQIKTKGEETEFEFCEMEDDESMLMIKNRTAILEESLSRALEENTSLKASNERYKNELETLSDTVMVLEKRKSELTAQVNHERKQNAILAKDLDAVNKSLVVKNEELGTVRNRIAELETGVKDLETSKQELMVIVEHSNKKVEEFTAIVEKEQIQCSEAQKTRDKLVSEKLQYLQKIAENRELAQNLSSDVNKKAQEISSLKEEKDNLNLVIVKLKQDLKEKDDMIKNLQCDLAAEKDKILVVKYEAENEAAKTKEELKTLSKKYEIKNTELGNIKDTVESLTAKVKSLEKEKDDLISVALSEAEGFEIKVKALLEEGLAKNEEVQRLEDEIEDLKSKIEIEKGRNAVLEEDYEAALRGLENQLEGEKALNKSLCANTDNAVSDLQEQLEHQLEVNAEQSGMLESKTVEVKEALEELEKERNQVKSLEERLKLAFAQLSAAHEEVKGLKSVKESLQTSLKVTKGKNLKSTNNSAASMYALQTAHSHLEKKYFEAKKKLEEMWKEKNDLKRALNAIQSGLPANDLRHEIEEFRAKNEDLRVRLNMGAEAFKSKFIECRKLQNQLKKLQRSPSFELISDNSAVLKLQQQLEEERSTGVDVRKALDIEKEKTQQKSQELEKIKLEVNQLRQNLETVESEGHQKSSSLSRNEEEKAELSAYTQKLETDIAERKNRLAEMEELFQNEKAEKHNLIEEIMNLQEQIKAWEQEKVIKNKEIEEIQLELAQEQEERDKLGEMARQRIQELEGTVGNLTEEVEKWKKEVERWKKEVDMHVEAESKMIGSTPENREVQQQTPSASRSPIQWPWNRNSHTGMVQPPVNQPWVMVPRDDAANPPPVNPYYTPTAPYPCEPTPPPEVTPEQTPDPVMKSLTTDRECPVCKILFPPSETIESIQTHVNQHFSETDQ